MTAGTGASAQTPGGGTFTSINLSAISGGTVAFQGNYSGGVGDRGFFANTGVGGALQAIATGGAGASAQVPGGGTFTGFGSRWGFDGTSIAFQANYSGGAGTSGIFANTGAGGALQTIASNGAGSNAVPGGGTFTDVGATRISDGKALFQGTFTGGNGTAGLFANTGAGGALQTIVTTGTGASAQVPGGGTFTGIFQSTFSGNTIAFLSGTSGGNGTHGIFANTGAGGALQTIVTAGTGASAQAPGGGTFNSIDAGALSGSGNNIAFAADFTGAPGGRGIFISSGGTLQKVVRQGDPLFGSTIDTLTLTSNALDGTDLMFRYVLADGRSGVALAALIPEPGTFALLALGLPLLLVRRRPSPRA